MKSGKAARGFVRQDLRRFNARWLAILVASFAGVLSLAGCGGSSSKQVTPTPTLTPSGGTYSSSQTVTISDTATGAVFYCTTDGSTPTTSSAQCAEPTTVSKSETLSVIAVAPGMSASAVASGTYTINLPAAATPVISPNGGTSITAQTVTITDTTSGAIIYYTTDGSDPSSSSTRLQYTSALTIASNVPLTETIKAVAIASNYSNSAVASATFSITPPTATPLIVSSATNVTYPNSLAVTLTDTDANATIYYTTNGTAPTTSSTKYTGAFNVSSPQTVEAIALDTTGGYSPSLTASQAFTVTEATPTFSLGAGKVSSGSQVSISDTDLNAAIYYTTNGATPTTSSTAYTGAITLSSSQTLNAIAVNASAGYTQSATATAAYSVPAAPTISGATSATYSASFAGLAVTISADSGATIYYTTDGSTPTASSNVYGSGITVAQTETVKAIAIVGGASSAVATQSFAVTEATPAFSQPTGSTIAAGSGVTITDADANATIYYTATASGTTPAISSANLYTKGTSIQVTATTVIEAIAVNTNSGSNYGQSAVAIGAYYPPSVEPTPTITPSGSTATYPSTLSATITDSGAHAALCYTLDGTTPQATVSGGNVTCTGSSIAIASGGSVTIEQTETLTAIAFDATGALGSSAAATQSFTIQEATPVFSPASGSQILGKVTIGDADPNAAIYYTTDGSTPSTSSTKYAGAFSYTAGQTLVAAAIDTTSGSNYTLSAPTSATTYTAYSGNVITGTVQSGSTPISGATVTLYAAGTTGYGAGSSKITLAAGSSAISSDGYSITTAADGSFALGFASCPTAPDDQLYLVASGGTFGTNGNGANSYIKLMTALGSCSSLPTTTSGGNTYVSATATVNEVTTIASAFSLSGFAANDSTNGGIDVGAPTNNGQTSCYNSTSSAWAVGKSNCNYPGLVNAFKTVNNLVNVTGAAQTYTYTNTGTSGSYSDAAGAARIITPAYSNGTTPTLTTDGALNSSGCSTSQLTDKTKPCPVVQYLNSSTVPQARLNTLANILAACVEDTSASLTVCKNGSTGLLDLAVTSAGVTPKDTLQAALNFAQNPAAYYNSTSNVGGLYALQPASDTATPAPAYGTYAASTLLTAAPNDFTLALSFTGAGLGTPFTSDSQFAMDANGNIFVSGYDSSLTPVETLLAVFNNQGAPLTPPTTYNSTTSTYTFGGYQNSSNLFFADIVALTFDQAGNLWIQGGLNGRAGALALASSGLGVTYGDAIVGLQNAAVDPAGNIWGQGGSILEEITASGSVVNLDGSLSLTGAPGDRMVFDNSGNLWIDYYSGKKLYLYEGTSNGIGNTSLAATYTVGTYQFLTAGAGGVVYGCDSTRYTIQTFSATNTSSNIAAYTLPNSQKCWGGRVVDGANNLWTAQPASPVYLLEISGDNFASTNPLLSPSTGYTGANSSSDTPLYSSASMTMAVDGSGNLWMMNPQNATSTTGQGNILVEFVGLAAPTIQPVSVAVQNAAQGTKP